MYRIGLVACLALASCHYHLPVWNGKVTVTAMERKSIAKCGTGALTAAGTNQVSRQPYLQSTSTTSTTVVWGSTDGTGEVVLSEPGAGVVARSAGTYAGDADRRAARLAAQHGAGKEVAPEDIYLMQAAFSKLAPGHLYCYQVVANGAPLTELAPLATAPPPGTTDPVRFVALGDSGTGGAAEHAIAQQMSAVTFDLMLFLGDIAYEEGSARQLQDNFFAVYRDFLRYVPAFTTIGNHERHTRLGRPYFEAFVLPEPERYYSFDWGDIHFVAIDTTQRDRRQLAWLDLDLAQNKLPWVIVFGHHPMYTNSLRGPQMWIRRAFANTFTRHGVNVVLTGHEHHYERFQIGGVNYIVSGGGGGRLTTFFRGSRALKQFSVHHFLSFEVTAKELVMKVIDISGNELESMRLTKQDGGTKVRINDKPEKPNTVPPEKTIVPDDKIHDEPDDDAHEDEPPKSEPAKPRQDARPAAPSTPAK